MRIYYASDIHGSRKCWLKFLATPKYYGADVIVVGGDITGKFITPIIRRNGHAEATFLGIKRKLKSEQDIAKLSELIANAGQYSVEMSPDEEQTYARDQAQVDALFQRVICERVEEWGRLADERLAGQRVRCFVSPGNDDSYNVDQALAKSKVIEVHDGRVVDLGDGFSMFGLGYSNITPWNCPRDISEEELAAKIDVLARQIERMDRAIFDIHVPPYDTGIDSAPELTSDMTVVSDSLGAPIMVAVGSTAVREAILKYQPMLSMHGHIHESSGVRKLGATTIVNPGSEYAEGILRGVLIDLDPREGLISANMVTG
ncbi:MAG: metallophosphoesterase [Chloroflexi bacterium]|nr:MAG: metallophosphoesterase [Chloroflexota bacterium]